jgi:hypothetical protein
MKTKIIYLSKFLGSIFRDRLIYYQSSVVILDLHKHLVKTLILMYHVEISNNFRLVLYFIYTIHVIISFNLTVDFAIRLSNGIEYFKVFNVIFMPGGSPTFWTNFLGWTLFKCLSPNTWCFSLRPGQQKDYL